MSTTLGIGLGIHKMGQFGGSGLTPLTFELGTPPTLILDASGVGDEALEIRPNCFFDYSATHYGLLYMAKANTANQTRTIKLATAPKVGFNHTWTKQGTVLVGGTSIQWDYMVASATVVKDGSTWIVMYESFDGGLIGLATGTDLLALTKHPSNPVIDNTASSGFNKYLRHPTAVIKDSLLYCIYEGRENSPQIAKNSKIGYATCPLTDLTDWTVSNTVLINPTNIEYALGSNSAIINCNITLIDGMYYLWFQSYPSAQDGIHVAYGGTSYAYSSDLLNWTIVGTKNYHIYMGLFGYNSSTEFYETCQEVTPVWDGTDLSLYMWSDTASGIGKIDFNGGTFVNQFRGFTMTDNFDDGSIDTSKWTVGSGTGITVSETGGKLQVVCDGLSNDTSFTPLLTSKVSMNNDDGCIVCCFRLQTDTGTGDAYVCEISSANRFYAFRVQRGSTPGKVWIRIFRNNVKTHETEVDYDGDDVFKFFVNARNDFEIWRGDGTNFVYLNRYVTNGMGNQDYTFKITAGNSIGGGQTIQIDDFAIGEFDSDLISTFQT